MKRPVLPKGKEGDPSYRILAARSLRKQVKQLAEHLGGVRRCGDVESVHRARVASRRLRAALGMFRSCWKRKQVKLWKKHIRRLAQNLGEARDHDVLIEFLASNLASAALIDRPAALADRERGLSANAGSALAPGIAALLNYSQREREWIQPRVVKAMDRFEKSGVLKTLQAALSKEVEKRRSVLSAAKDLEIIAGENVRGRTVKILCKRLQHLHEEAGGLADFEQHEQHHAMRIAAKRLRYTLELARPFYSSDLTEADEAVRKLQTLLGEIHDCDVWGANFEEFAHRFGREQRAGSREKKRRMLPTPSFLPPFERLRCGLDYLGQERMDRRRRVFDELASFWQELKDRGVWERLETILECRGKRSGNSGKIRQSRLGESPAVA